MILYNDSVTEKVQILKEKDKLEQLILDLEKTINKDDLALEKLNNLKKAVFELQKKLPTDDHKKYLAEIVLEEQNQFSSNSLILAPVGSGKSTLIKNVLINSKDEKKSLILVSTRFLKETVLKNDENLGIKVLKKKYNNNDSGKIILMTYHEFGLRIKDNNSFVENVGKIFCDEVHSLPEYKEYSGSGNFNLIKFALEHAMKYLFNKQPGKQIFYFTATDENFLKLKKARPELVKDVKVYDYRKHPEIKQYMELSKAYITHIEQIRPFLKERKESFDYFKSKGLAFGKTIANLKVIEKILEEEGYNPLVLWSDMNEEYKLTKEQQRARNYLIKHGKIPDKYNFLVMNSALREGWDLKDPSVRIAIMNTTSETDRIQARGRIRKDIDLIIYKTTENLDKLHNEQVMSKYINVPLTTKEKSELAEILDLRDKYNRLLKWRTVSKTLKENGYEIKDSKTTINGKRITVSTITIKTSRD